VPNIISFSLGYLELGSAFSVFLSPLRKRESNDKHIAPTTNWAKTNPPVPTPLFGYFGSFCASDFGVIVPVISVQTVPILSVRFVPVIYVYALRRLVLCHRMY
jgi:hypothetical protein